jgi:hypothetical protein
MQTRLYRLMLILTCLEGIIALIFLFESPSEAKHAWLFGYSMARVFTGGTLLGLLALIIAITLISVVRNDWFIGVVKTIERFLFEGENFSIVLINIGSLLVFCVLLLVIRYMVFQYVGMLAVAIERVKFVILWGIIILIQLVVLLQVLYRNAYPKPSVLSPAMLGKFLLVFSIIVSSLIHWAILYFQIPIFVEIPHWFWNFHPKTNLHLEWIFLIMIAASVMAALYYLNNPRRPRWTLVFLIILGYLIQVGFGFIEGKGLESIRENYTDTMHRAYAEFASDDPDLLSVVTDYENQFSGNNFTGTKPPGVVMVYIAMEKLSNAISPEDTFQGRFDRLTALITYVFPLFSFLIVIPLFFFSRHFLSEEDAIIPAILYLFTPNILLIPLFLDQVLYPLVFLLCIFVVYTALKRCSYWLSFFAGCLLYLAVFLTFSMIPTIFLAFLMIGLYYLIFLKQNKPKPNPSSKHKKMKMVVFMSFSMLAGLFALFVVFRVFFHYNPFIRYENAMASHQQIKSFDPSLSHLLNNLLLNNLDYSSWLGFPLALLGLVALVITIKRLLTQKAGLIDWLAISFFITYLILNILGQTQSETGRLWMFFNPILVVFASSVIAKTYHRKGFLVCLFIVLQLVTTFLIFVFQDFRG